MTHKTMEETVNGSEAARAKLLDLEIKRLLQQIHRQEARFYDANPKAISDPTEILVRAARDGDLEIVDAALAAGAQINGRSFKDMDTALTAALTSNSLLCSENRRIDFVRQLLKRGPDANAPGINGWTPLTIACRVWIDPRFVELLLEHGADPNLTDEEGQMPIMAILCSRQPDEESEILALLIKFGAKVNASGPGGNTALHIVVSRRASRCGFSEEDRKDLDRQDIETASFLMECGASPNIRNNNAETPLTLAVKIGSTHMAKLLRENGASL